MALPKLLTEADYFRISRANDAKLDFIKGRIIDARAMAGGTYGHSLASSNLIRTLGNALKGRPCRAHGSELRVGKPEGGYVFPDALVECGKPEFSEDEPKDTLLNPVAVYEVLSPSSEHYDREDKRDLYVTMPSVREIVLVHTRSPRIDRYVRFEGGWRWEAAVGLGATLRTVGVEIPLTEIYDGVDFSPEETE